MITKSTHFSAATLRFALNRAFTRTLSISVYTYFPPRIPLRTRDAFPLLISKPTSTAATCFSSSAVPVRSITMAPAPEMPGWTLLGTPSKELRLEFTLPTGQSFRWREITPGSGEYIGVLGRRAVALRQLEDNVAYRVLSRAPEASASDDAAAIADYFNLDVKLAELAEQWKTADPHFARLSGVLPGARMLRQDPVECLFSFICSQNNHISRIHGMVNRLCQDYGTLLPISKDDAAAEKEDENKLYAFPTLEQLSKATEEELRDAGFGYRARYIVGAVEELAAKPKGGANWLAKLRSVPFEEAVEELCSLPGVGPKVAACVALFSLDKHEAIPVDVHVWALATKRYCTHLKGKTNNPKLHPEVQAAFVKLFGPYAGWAHNTLFIGELGSMKDKIAAALSDADEDESNLSSCSDSEEESASESEEEYTVVVKKIKTEEDAGEGVVTTPQVMAEVRRKPRKAAVKAMRKMQTSAAEAQEIKIE